MYIGAHTVTSKYIHKKNLQIALTHQKHNTKQFTKTQKCKYICTHKP